MFLSLANWNEMRTDITTGSSEIENRFYRSLRTKLTLVR